MAGSDYTPKSNYHNGKKRQQCYFCECGPPLREHHIIPQRFDGPDTDENIVEVCDLCHRRLERLYDKSFYEWFGITDEKGKRTYHRQCDQFDCNNRRKVKTRSLADVSHSTRDKMHRYLFYEFGPEGRSFPDHDTKYYCNPCAAKLAKTMLEALWWVYEKRYEEYHGEIRKMYEADFWEFDEYRDRWVRTHANSSAAPEKPDKPDYHTPEQIYGQIVIEEAGEREAHR